MPEVAASLAAAAFTILGMLAALFGLIGSSKPTIVSHQTNSNTVPSLTSPHTTFDPYSPVLPPTIQLDILPSRLYHTIQERECMTDVILV